MTKRPPFLKKGDKIAIVAPARKISLDEISAAQKVFESWGLNVIIGKTINTNSHTQLSADDNKRAEDLQTFLDREDIAAIVCARGGYGCVKIIDRLDFTSFIKYPKWLIGYSDFTIFLSHLYYCNAYQSLHATMPINILSDTQKNCCALTSLKETLFGINTPVINWKSNYIIEGKASAEVICGNLSVLYSLIGSKSFLSTTGKILLIEDLDEYLYHIDRMITALDRAGKLAHLSGLIVGSFTQMHDNDTPFGKNVYEIISDIVAKYGYPLAFDIPVGHIGENNHAIINGAHTVIEITSRVCTFTQF
ncbi:MAG: LD-carboxypeptidase [Bacteroidales bacterium]|jgi:muramoyltetrapeptide carboxypeptidase|nr:LD-carboxypeptidase [Bacteroidales bacterium]